MVPAEFVPFLRAKVVDGILPRWSDWWEEEEVASLYPDQETRGALTAEEPRLPLAYYEQTIPVPGGWDRRPCAYLWFGPPYDETAKLAGDRATILKTGAAMRVLSHGGSNAIAVAPSRSADHHALLWGAPQEGFGTPSVDGEEYLHAPGYDAGGMYITGEPFILIGRNANLAWTTTSEELVDRGVIAAQGFGRKRSFSPLAA